MTHGQVTIYDASSRITLYTYHTGDERDLLDDIYLLASDMIRIGAAPLHWLYEGNPDSEEVDRRLALPLWKDLSSNVCWKLGIITLGTTQAEVAERLQRPDFNEDFDRNLYYQVCPSTVAVALTARHWDRWFPYPPSQRHKGSSGLRIKCIDLGGPGCMNWDLQPELPRGYYDKEWIQILRDCAAKHLGAPGVHMVDGDTSGFPAVNFGVQYKAAMKKELIALLPKMVNLTTPERV